MKRFPLSVIVFLILMQFSIISHSKLQPLYWWNNPETLSWTNFVSPLVPCSETAGAYLDNKFYQICGTYGYSEQNYLYMQIYNNISWSQSSVQHPKGVHRHSAAVWNEKIVVSGGASHGDPSGYYDITTVYDPSGPTWLESTPMPLPYMSMTAMASYNGKCYLFGGSSGVSVLSNTYQWTPGDSTMIPKANMPLARYRMSAAECNGKIYIFGGYNAGVHNDIWEFDPVSDNWAVKNATLIQARSGSTATTIGNKIYIVGGSNGIVGLNSVEIYDPASDSISIGPSILYNTCYQAAAGCTIPGSNSVYTGKIYVTGGGDIWDPPSNANLGTVTGVYFDKVDPTSLGNLKALYH